MLSRTAENLYWLARHVEREAFLAAGFQAVVTKPVLDHRELLAVITSLLPSGAAPRYEPPASPPWRDRSHVSRALTVPGRGGMIASYGFSPPSTPDAA